MKLSLEYVIVTGCETFRTMVEMVIRVRRNDKENGAS